MIRKWGEPDVMLIFKILCGILFFIFGCMLILVLAAIPRTGMRITCKDGLTGIWIRYGWGKLRIFPFESPKKSSKSPDKPAPAQSPYDFSQIDLGDALCLLLDLLYELRMALRLDTIRADVLVATGDAAHTGILLGQIAALTGMITPFLEQHFNIRDYHIAVDGDFQGNTPHWEGELIFSVRPIRLIWALIKRWRSLKALYNSILTTEANNHE